VRLSLALEVGEIVPEATPAIEVALNLDGLKITGPHIARNEPPVKRFVIAAKELRGFGNLQGRH
jgi:hypothetical protein